jgi:lysophospholipase L1-like esterase
MLLYPDALDGVLEGVTVSTILEQRDGLPRTSAALRGDGSDDALRVCFLGGSVTEQRSGYRPRVSSWLGQQAAAIGRMRVEEVPAFCGNTGSKVLAFMVADWVVARRPHLVFIELVINDGDTLLETDDPESIGSALEGIVRHVRDALPRAEICLLYMFVRDDLPLQMRTGSKAWADNDDAAAVEAYHDRIPQLHSRVCERYGLPSINLVPLMARVPPRWRQQLFRDDCHVHDPGGAFAAAAICAALQELTTAAGGKRGVDAAKVIGHVGSLPSPLHHRPWGRGRAEPVVPQQLSFFYTNAPPRDAQEQQALQQRILKRHSQLDMDPLDNSQQKPWWLLYPGDRAELHFTGTRLGLLTMIGPDSGVVVCEVDGGKWMCRRVLLDRWAYFWRLAVVALVEELPPGPHVAVLWLEEGPPDRTLLKRSPSGPHWAQCLREEKDHKLWLMHWLIEEASESERWLVRPDPHGGMHRSSKVEQHEVESQPMSQPRRLGGASVSRGGRRADA